MGREKAILPPDLPAIKFSTDCRTTSLMRRVDDEPTGSARAALEHMLGQHQQGDWGDVSLNRCLRNFKSLIHCVGKTGAIPSGVDGLVISEHTFGVMHIGEGTVTETTLIFVTDCSDNTTEIYTRGVTSD